MEPGITSKKKVENKDGSFHYEVTFNNGWEFICDQNGENWKRAKFHKEPDDEKLLGNFIKFLKKELK